MSNPGQLPQIDPSGLAGRLGRHKSHCPISKQNYHNNITKVGHLVLGSLTVRYYIRRLGMSGLRESRYSSLFGLVVGTGPRLSLTFGI